uniref:Uncharacterized protein n=1 Tax=Triticum urartu TaxID=4572 RepID=A0A8R7QFS2_TRIUA
MCNNKSKIYHPLHRENSVSNVLKHTLFTVRPVCQCILLLFIYPLVVLFSHHCISPSA